MNKTRLFKLLALALPLLGWILVDVGLWTFGVLPPEDPLLFYTKTFDPTFSPYEDTGDGYLTIKPDWTSDGTTLTDVRGQRAGRILMLPGFRPGRITVTKDPGTLRVFVLGGSTTFGLGVGQDDAFASLLGQGLQAQMPNQKIELVNLGCPGWASGRIKNLLTTVLGLEPDLIVLYSGHNEMLEGHAGSEADLNSSQQVATQVLSFSPLASWAQYAVSRWRNADQYEVMAEEAAAVQAGQVLIHDPTLLESEEHQLPPAEFLDKAEDEYRANLQSMIDQTNQADVPFLMVLPVVNWSIPPGASAHSESFASKDLFDSLLNQARTAVENQHWMDSVAFLDQAIELSPQHAQTHYWRAASLGLAGENEPSYIAFQKAVELDVRTHRITPRLERALAETASASGVPWVDLRLVFWNQLRSTPPNELFFDHCHPTHLGHRLIGHQLILAAHQVLTISQSGHEER